MAQGSRRIKSVQLAVFKVSYQLLVLILGTRTSLLVTRYLKYGYRWNNKFYLADL